MQFAPSHFPLLCLRSEAELSSPAKTPVFKSEFSIPDLSIFRSHQEENAGHVQTPDSTSYLPLKLLGHFGVAAVGEGVDRGEGGGGGGGGSGGGGGGGLFVGLRRWEPWD